MMKTKNVRFVLSSKYAVCGCKKSKFMKEQEAKGLLSNLGIGTPKTFKLYGPLSWMGFNCLEARVTSRRQFTFYN